MVRHVELLVTNTTEHPVEKGRGITFEPGEATNILIPDGYRVSEISTDRRLNVERVAVHEEQEPRINLKEAQRDLAAAEEEWEKAEKRVEELSSQLATLDLSLRDTERTEIEEKKRAALQGERVAVLSEADGIKEEIEQTSYQLWAAQVRLHQAEAETLEAQAPVVTARQQGLRQKLGKAEAKVQAAVETRDQLKADLGRLPDTFDLKKRARVARLRAAKVEEKVPVG